MVVTNFICDIGGIYEIFVDPLLILINIVKDLIRWTQTIICKVPVLVKVLIVCLIYKENLHVVLALRVAKSR